MGAGKGDNLFETVSAPQDHVLTFLAYIVLITG